MSYFIFLKNSDNLIRSLYKIAENNFDLNNLNIIKSDYKIIENQNINFNEIKFNKIIITGYNQDKIIYENSNTSFLSKTNLKNYIDNFKYLIKNYLNNNQQSSIYNKWNNYYNQLNEFNIDDVQFPLTKSLEEYFNDLNKPSLHPLQLP